MAEGEGRYPINPEIHGTAQNIGAPKTATVLSNPVRKNNPYSAKQKRICPWKWNCFAI